MEVLRTVQHLNDALLQKLIQALPKLFKLRRVRIVEIRESFGREPRNFFVNDRRIGGERVADAKPIVPDQADDVAGIGFIHRFALVAEKFVGTGEANLFLRARMRHGHVAFKFPGTNPDESDAVAMPRIHVRLNFENESGERGIFRGNLCSRHDARFRRRRMFQEIHRATIARRNY